MIGLLAVGVAMAQEAPVDDAFAAHLLTMGQAQAAWVEYERLAFGLPPGLPADRMRFQAGAALWADGRDEEALAYLTQARAVASVDGAPLLAMAEAETLYRLGRDTDVGLALGRLNGAYPAVVAYREGWLLVRQDETEGAAAVFEALAARPLSEDPNDALLQPAARQFAVELRALPPLRHKSPLAAGLLSAAVPGVGQVYAGEARELPASLLVNGALIGSTAWLIHNEQWAGAALTGTLALGFYSGNIYSAVNSAHRFNRRQQRARQEALAAEHGLRVGLGPEGAQLDVQLGAP